MIKRNGGTACGWGMFSWKEQKADLGREKEVLILELRK